MKKTVLYKSLLSLGLGGALLAGASAGYASAFQIYEQDASEIGDYHAGAASEAVSASTTYYNPAGLTNIKNKQLTFGLTDADVTVPYKGTVNVSTLDQPYTTNTAQAQGGSNNFIPNFYFSMPLSQKWALGFGMNTPFGLKTAYQGNTYVKYAATTTSLQVADFIPAVAYQPWTFLSLGAGLDIQYMKGVFDQYAAIFDPSNASRSKNTGDAWGLGYHLGMLFHFNNNNTRVGVVYHSHTNFVLRGDSRFSGPMANEFQGGSVKSDKLRAGITLPSFATLSAYQNLSDQWAVLGSVSYTWWDTSNRLVLRNVETIDITTFDPLLSSVTVVEKYKNTQNYALGVHYTPIQKLTLKAGMGYENTPTHRPYRNVQLPDQNRFALAFGGHYQLDKHLGVDAGYTHFFVKKAKIYNVQSFGQEVVTTNGYSNSYANIYGLQFTYQFT